jgi:hypothetical protein
MCGQMPKASELPDRHEVNEVNKLPAFDPCLPIRAQGMRVDALNHYKQHSVGGNKKSQGRCFTDPCFHLHLLSRWKAMNMPHLLSEGQHLICSSRVS